MDANLVGVSVTVKTDRSNAVAKRAALDSLRNQSDFGSDLPSVRSRLPGPAEEQDVAVGVADLEAAKAVVGILKGGAECCSTLATTTGKSIGKFKGKRIRVWGIDEGIPPH